MNMLITFLIQKRY